MVRAKFEPTAPQQIYIGRQNDYETIRSTEWADYSKVRHKKAIAIKIFE